MEVISTNLDENFASKAKDEESDCGFIAFNFQQLSISGYHLIIVRIMSLNRGLNTWHRIVTWETDEKSGSSIRLDFKHA